jgi:hypothetical protein
MKIKVIQTRFESAVWEKIELNMNRIFLELQLVSIKSS